MIRDYIAVDVETTGLNPARDRLLEIGAARILNGKVEETYQTFIDAGVEVPERITELTGITDEMRLSDNATRAGNPWNSWNFAGSYRFLDIMCPLILDF